MNVFEVHCVRESAHQADLVSNIQFYEPVRGHLLWHRLSVFLDVTRVLVQLRRCGISLTDCQCNLTADLKIKRLEKGRYAT